MIKYKVKARIAKNIGTDDFSLEEFKQTFEDKKSPINARKKAYSFYESIIDIIDEKNKIESGKRKKETVEKKAESESNITNNKSKSKILDYAKKWAKYSPEVRIYALNDNNEDLFDMGCEYIIMSYHYSFSYLELARNLENEIKIYKKNNWDTEDWTVKIKYWDYEGDYDSVYEPTVLFTPDDFWSDWNPEIAKAEDEYYEEQEDSLIDKMISSGENRNLEFKSSLRYCFNKNSAQKYVEEEIIRTITAFANTEGGTLFVGVDDDGNVLGLDNDFNTFKGNSKDKFLKHFANLVSEGFTEPIDALLKYNLENTNGKSVFIVIVEKSAKPRFGSLKNGDKEFYIRRSAISQNLNVEEAVKYVIDKWHTHK